MLLEKMLGRITMTSLRMNLIDNLSKVAALLQYVLVSPRWTLAVIRSKFFTWENFFHRVKSCVYEPYMRPLKKALATALSVSQSAVSPVLGSVTQEKLSREIRSQLDSIVNPIPGKWDADVSLTMICYTVCRLLRPTTVIETGVARGITSTFILQALQENKKGQLYSIDLPAPRKDAHLFVGSAIPERLKERWTLILDDSLHALPKLIRHVGDVDVFIHDSEHSYRQQTMEYAIAWNSLRSGGVLIADDVNNSDALIEFSKIQKVQPLVVEQSAKGSLIGLLVRP